MKLYYVFVISGIDIWGYTTVGKSYEEVFSQEIKRLREKCGNTIDKIVMNEIKQSNGYKVALEKIDTSDFSLVAGKMEI